MVPKIYIRGGTPVSGVLSLVIGPNLFPVGLFFSNRIQNHEKLCLVPNDKTAGHLPPSKNPEEANPKLGLVSSTGGGITYNG
mmetsp:Transcript_12361/g.28628  ORF Transcript_12361/g.28628 Transcript_12361/m.28628 type:complete len:82 (+) Transcript_12361:1006-1251(+)